MARTTIDIDLPILDSLKKLSNKEQKSLKEIVSEVLAIGLSARRQARSTQKSKFKWHTKKMEAHFDIADKDLLYSVLDKEPSK